MQKPYSSPRLLQVSRRSEGALRALLTPLLLCPSVGCDRVYSYAKQLLFSLECDVALRNIRCFLSGIAKPPIYRVGLESVFKPLLTAAQHLLADTSHSFSAQFRGNRICDIPVPRYLQLALLSLVRSCLNTRAPFSVTVDLSACNCTFESEHPLKDLYFPRAVAALYGGRVLQSDATCVFQLSPHTRKTACPRWQPPGTDGLLHDPLSVVHLALSDLYSSAGSS